MAAGGDKIVVLLVDDEPTLGKTLGRLLEVKGFSVRLATEADEALAIAADHGPIHVLLSDVLMPEMSGPDLAAKVLEIRPDCRVLFMSGYTDDELAKAGLLGKGLNFIPKPFPIEELVGRIRQLMAPE